MPALQMRNDVVVDSGPLLALFDRDDAHHARVRQAVQRNQGLRHLPDRQRQAATQPVDSAAEAQVYAPLSFVEDRPKSARRKTHFATGS